MFKNALINLRRRLFVGVSIFSYTLDPEGAFLATQIASVLHTANIETVDKIGGVTPMKSFLFATHISGEDRELVEAMRSAFDSVGVELAPEDEFINRGPWITSGDPNLDPPVHAIILVGVKPIKTTK